MLPLMLTEVAAAIGAAANAQAQITAVTTDSREAAPGALFIALQGEKFDGNDFAESFLQNGGAAAVVSRPFAHPFCLQVPDTHAALGQLAAAYRAKLSLPVIAVTGSVGKTSTRRMLECALSGAGAVRATKGNLNNDIGLPRTIFTLEAADDYAVLEMGMNHKGEIAYLTHIARPNIAVITNIGTAHIGNLGSREGIRDAKLEILEGLLPGGTAVLNGDDEYLWNYREHIRVPILWYGIENPECNVRASAYAVSAAQSVFTSGGQSFTVPIAGRHHVYNALAAVAVGQVLGIGLPVLSAGIACFAPEGMRQNSIEFNSIQFILDCYNANPDSMRAALDVLACTPAKRRIAVLGDMYELGSFTQEGHRRTGEYAAKLRTIGQMAAIGNLSRQTAAAAEESGMPTKWFATNAEAAAYLRAFLQPGDAVLFKASRGAKLEEVSEALMASLRE
ncbi:MAG: UDP-N-acetylmuramoyl-tripeptide--D-alanyl-D-alanine ligase [Oscillospiraceae bacterium]|jgi:UDP-N-acetylmuramoyl-tripeptide--D-alanyl-D-alanine ligase|nr:UDP-N-acetylmuramoyl-tripeptide--D-alanyl-D-alanine ligase [Oscillospiraceae bacterium]